MGEIKLGKYRHFKGGVYEVVGVARHSETLEEIVVYKNAEGTVGKGELWVRSKKMFLEEVEINGKKMPRFEYLG